MTDPEDQADFVLEEGVGEREWSALLARTSRPPLEQSFAFGASMAAFGRVPRRFLLRRKGEPVALAQVIEQRLGPLRLCHLLRGPLPLQGGDPSALGRALALLRRRYRPLTGRIPLFTPELPAGPTADALCRAAGMGRVVTGYSTSWVDLTVSDIEAGLGGSFRKSLKKARAEKLSIAFSHGGADLDWIIRHHDAHRRRRGLMAPPARQAAALVAAQVRPRDVLACVARRGSAILAGALFIRHAHAATYYLGAGTEEARTACAQHLLLREAMGRLAADGVRWLDLGGLNSDGMKGVARFKLGLGGELVTLAGTYL
ncbi:MULTISPECIES: GNAT family N-acetyltransferase [unclassified Azospirillum]|uniref:GNAT family N-acetyltransferase n=1 Tax=unclassified Azospirillum TaxID=2630922 RepID=UPI000B6F72F4|nr:MULTISPECIES: GNAT family N-acetyltransferase [unclassified Azospirillum]SNT22074.1 Acetyltransferase (GNAT) domain-containing protein [Azospirillum sp. RU38E]SNT33517.1 Acetyltransferase (GNAT) domain-containing protein [Azospirillum sp. RU37A]